MAEVRRLLIRAPNWIGDAVLSLGAVRDMRRNFPHARIEVLARPWVAGLYSAVAELDAVRECAGFGAGVRAVRGEFDAAVLLPNSFGSALQVFAAGIPERWGYATDGRGALLTRRARVPRAIRGWSEVYYYRAMLAGVGLEVSASPDVSLRCPLEWSARADALLGGQAAGGWIGLNAGAAFGSAKCWIPARYSAVAEALARRTQARIAILGGPAERPLGEAIAQGTRATSRILCGETSLPELVGILSRLRLLLTNDSGPMHLASALGVPVVAIFGPTDWRETAPLGARRRLVREPVECSPCKLRECPIDHRCMSRITAERVLHECVELLKEPSAISPQPPGTRVAAFSDQPSAIRDAPS
jgi:heptosyltransferase-2